MTQAKTQKSNGLAIASLVLGIITIVTFLWWFVALITGALAIVFGALSLKSSKGLALGGLVTGIVGIVLSILTIVVILAAIPALQANQSDTARKNDVGSLSSDVVLFQSINAGTFPTAADLSTGGLLSVTDVSDAGNPTTTTVLYEVGVDCDGHASERAYSLSVLLESGDIYCQGY